MATPAQVSAAAILSQLHQQIAEATLSERSQLSNDAKANQLLHDNSFAFLLAVIADYGIEADRAWSLPYLLQTRLGSISPQTLAQMSVDELSETIRAVHGHRFPVRVADFFLNAAKRVISDYQGDADRLLKQRRVIDVERDLWNFRGIGQKKGSMAVNILARDLGWLTPAPEELKYIDVSYDVQVQRVFIRAGLASHNSEEEIVQAARRLAPDYPGRLDIGAWEIGRKWCRPKNPNCPDCPLAKVCPKLIQ
jgi:endonuclease-3